jgi:glyoxylase-like metal-dependent hydrolase (beta-lactamase superfamily II)
MTIQRLNLGYFVRPAAETDSGEPRVEPVLAYLVRRGDGLLLFDTGMGTEPEVDAHYRPRRHDLRDALGRAGAQPSDVRVVVNCHLHFDHCGGNPQFAGRLILAHAPN